MKNKAFIVALLLSVIALSSCVSAQVEKHAGTVAQENGYDCVLFDSDGDGVKDDRARLACLGMAGGYGAFRLEVFNGEAKIFDSENYSIDEQTYEKLSESIDGELVVDSFYSVEAIDVDNDACDELVCRQYAWADWHSNHIGDVLTTFKISDFGIEIIEVRLETRE